MFFMTIQPSGHILEQSEQPIHLLKSTAGRFSRQEPVWLLIEVAGLAVIGFIIIV